jgi:hypothetical protein
VTAPVGATISVLPGEVRLSGAEGATGVRLVNDPDAPAFKAMRTDLLYPHRQTELLKKVNLMLPEGSRISGHDITCVRKTHDVNQQPNFFYKPQYSSPQYSDAFADWLAAPVPVSSSVSRPAGSERVPGEQVCGVDCVRPLMVEPLRA